MLLNGFISPTRCKDIDRQIEIGFRVKGGAEQSDLSNPVKQAVIIFGAGAESAQFAYQVGKVQLPRQLHG